MYDDAQRLSSALFWAARDASRISASRVTWHFMHGPGLPLQTESRYDA